MSISEIISVCLSILAVTVSFLSLYFNFFHRKASMIGVLASVWQPEDEGDIELEYSLGNTGNIELLIREVFLEVFPSGSSEVVPEVENKELPEVIIPGKIKLIKVKLPYPFFVKKHCKDGRKILINFEIKNSHGKTYILTHKFFFEELDNVIPSEQCWDPFPLEKVDI